MIKIVIAKAASIERCIQRVREEFLSGEGFIVSFSMQDAAMLNILRACEQTIDLANHLIRNKYLGFVYSNRESFDRLVEAEIITANLGDTLKKRVGFRNIAVQKSYTEVELEIVKAIITVQLDDLLRFADICLKLKTE